MSRSTLTINLNDDNERDNALRDRVIALTAERKMIDRHTTRSTVLYELLEQALNDPQFASAPTVQQVDLAELQAQMVAMFTELEARLLGRVMAMRGSGEVSQEAAQTLAHEVSDSFNIEDVPAIALAAAKSTFKPGIRLKE